jgi:hypothetical protein
MELERSPTDGLRALARLASASGDLVASEALHGLNPAHRLSLIEEEDASLTSFVATLLTPEAFVETVYTVPQRWNPSKVKEAPEVCVREVQDILVTALADALEERQDAILRALTERDDRIGWLILGTITHHASSDDEGVLRDDGAQIIREALSRDVYLTQSVTVMWDRLAETCRDPFRQAVREIHAVLRAPVMENVGHEDLFVPL